MSLGAHQSLTAGVLHRRFPNGLTLLIKQIPATQVVAIDIWVKVGYFDEEDDEVGISHVIEHMFFKGTITRPRPEQIASEVKALGGELNAGTYYDFTHYYFTLPAESLSRGLEIQADALLHPLVDGQELARELEAIIQEALRKQDNPTAFAVEKLNELAYSRHRIRRWRIGHEEALRSFTRDKLLQFSRKHYLPENIILTVVGDLEPQRVAEEAEKLFGDLHAPPAPPRQAPSEPPQSSFRFSILRGDVKRAHLMASFRSAPLFHADDLPTRILATVLGRGRSSRLVQEVKERRACVESIGAATEAFTDLGVLRIFAEMDPQRVAEAAESIAAVLEGMRRHPPTAMEILRARSAVESQYYHSQGDVTGMATNLAYYQALGDYRLADEFVQKLQAVTPEAVGEAASSVLRMELASLLAYLPEDLPAPFAGPDAAAALFTAAAASAPPRVELPQEITRPPGPDAIASAAAPPRRLPLPGGAVLLVEEIPRLPVTSVALLFRGGRLVETAGNSGISRLTLASMMKGTHRRDALQLASEMESFGCTLDRVLDDDYLGFSVSILSRFLPGGLDLILDVVRNPAFAAAEVERERRVQRSAMESLKDQAMGYTATLFREVAFAGHVYGLPPYGSPESVEGLTPEVLRRWHALVFRPEKLVVAVAGNLKAESVQALLAERMIDWRGPAEMIAEPEAARPVEGIVRRVETRKKAQTFQMIGFPGVNVASELNYPLDLLQSAVSGLGGIFFEAVRGKRGLAYVVGAANMAKRLGGYFVVYLGTSPDKEEEARRILLDEIAQFHARGIPEAEILRARSYVLGTYPIALQTNVARALTYAATEVQDRGMEEVLAYRDRIRSVTPGQVEEAARLHLDPSRYALGILKGA